MVEKNYLNLDSMAQRKKNVRIGSDFLIGPNDPREIWYGLDPKKMTQYRCVINITWLPLMKHAMLVKKMAG